MNYNTVYVGMDVHKESLYSTRANSFISENDK